MGKQRRPMGRQRRQLSRQTAGGDADTIACMTGAIAGAHLGEDAIPEPWREGVEDAAYIRELADRLLSAQSG